jgi:hypothetical protein
MKIRELHSITKITQSRVVEQVLRRPTGLWVARSYHRWSSVNHMLGTPVRNAIVVLAKINENL